MGAEGEIGSGGGVGMTGSVRTAFENEDPEMYGWLHDASGMEEDLAKYGEDELIVNALKVAGGDFWQVTRDLEAGLRREETSAVEEYVHQSAGVAELRLQIEQCDGVLSVFEDLLHKCQSDLGNIAGGVRHMKERADAFDVLSNNRQSAETSVVAWIEAVCIPRGLSRAIHEVDVGEEGYCEHLRVLQDKLAFVESHTHAKSGEMPVCCNNAAQLLRRLQARAVDRISAHLKIQMRNLEDDNQLLYAFTLGQAGKADPNQLLYALTLGQAGGKGALQQLRERQQILLKSSPLILFLISNTLSSHDHPAQNVYNQVLGQYTETMRAALASQIRAEYRGYALAGVHEVITSRHVLFPEIERAKSRMSALLHKSAAMGSKSLARSLAGLKGVTKGVVGAAKGELNELKRLNPYTWDTAHEAAEDDWRLNQRLETMFGVKSVHGEQKNDELIEVLTAQPPELVLHRLLLSFGDLLDNESLLVCRLFPQRSGDELLQMFVPALQVIREAADALVHSTTDPISLLLMVLSLEISQRNVCDVLCCDAGTGAAFDDFYMWGYMTVWPRFKESVEAQIASVRDAAFTVVVSTSMSEIRLFTQRYAHLSAAFYLIDEQLQTQTAEMGRMSLKYLWMEVSKAISSFGQQVGGGQKGSVLVTNQLHDVLALYYELGVCAEACAPLRQAVEECLSVLLPLVLGERYSILLAFMQDDLGVGEGGGADFSRAEEVIIAFKQHWKMDFATTAAYLRGALSRPEDAREVAKKALVKMVHLYLRVCQHIVGAKGKLPQMVSEELLVKEIDKLTSFLPQQPVVAVEGSVAAEEGRVAVAEALVAPPPDAPTAVSAAAASTE